MNIYDLWTDTDHFDSLDYKNLSEMTTGHRFTGGSLAAVWKPVEVVYFNYREKGDYPDLRAGIPPVFTEKTLKVLLPHIEKDVEVLPLACETEKLYAINVTTVVDCFDFKQSKYVTFNDSDRIMDIRKYKFQTELLVGKIIFRLPDLISNRVFVLDAFKRIVEENGLKGFRFMQVG